MVRLKLLRAILVFIDTQNWHASVSPSEAGGDLSEVREAAELITSEFKEPLEAKAVDLASIQDEVEEICGGIPEGMVQAAHLPRCK